MISRAEAQALGLKKFFTGQPCRRGHVAERYTNGGACVECVRLDNALKGREYKRRYEDKGKATLRHESRRKVAKDGGYHPPPPESQCPLRPADGLCDYCLRPLRPELGEPWLDHDHTAPGYNFRGWVCAKCNREGKTLTQHQIDGHAQRLPWQ